MGMFDTVRSEIALPDGFTGELQSKDLDCTLTTILIRADGRLLIEERDFVYDQRASDEQKPFKPALGVKVVHRRWRDLDYYGDFRFYGTDEIQPGDGHVFHLYVARFTNGTIEYIKNEEWSDRHPRPVSETTPPFVP